jgi:hypothetical protein
LQGILIINLEGGQGWKRAFRAPEVRASHRDSPRRAPLPTRAPTPLTLDSIKQAKKVKSCGGERYLAARATVRCVMTRDSE